MNAPRKVVGRAALALVALTAASCGGVTGTLPSGSSAAVPTAVSGSTPAPSPSPSPSSSPIVGTFLTLSGDRSGQLTAANSRTRCGSQDNGPSDPRYQYIDVEGTLTNQLITVMVANPATQQAVIHSGIYVREGSPDQVSAGWQTTSTTGISSYSNTTGVSVDADLMPLTTYSQGGGSNARALLHVSGQIVCAQ